MRIGNNKVLYAHTKQYQNAGGETNTVSQL
jgi:hypothetical protein